MAEKPITVDDVRKALREGLKPVTSAPVAPEAEPVITVDDVRLFLKGNPPDELATEKEPVKLMPPITKTAPKAKPTHTGKKAR